MHISIRTMLTGVASLALVAIAAPSVAADGQIHTLTLQLPNGAIEQIEYAGDVAPQIVLSPPAMIAAPPLPAMAPAWDSSLAALTRMTAILDQQEEAEEAAMARAAAVAPPASVFEALPSASVTYVSTYVSDGACTRTTHITYSGDGMAPQTVSGTSGACGAETGRRGLTQISSPHHPMAPAARLIEARTADTRPARDMVHEAVWRP